MTTVAYTEVNSLGTLPDFVARAAGPEALARIFRDQEVPLSITGDPDAPLLFRDCMGLFVRAACVTGDRCPALRIGPQYRIGDLGPFGAYIAAPRDLAEGLARARDVTRFGSAFSRQDVDLDGDTVRLSYVNAHQEKVGWRHQGDMILCLLLDYMRGYLGDAWKPEHVEVTYPRGPWEQDLEDLFGVPVLFDRPAEALVFERDWLTAPHVDRPPQGPIVTRADVARAARRLPMGFVAMVRETMRQRILLQRTDQEGLAERLGMEVRTLQRRLAEHGLTYRALLAELLRQRAIDLLAEASLSVADVSIALGYAYPAHFQRAFKTWTGSSPSAFRKDRTGFDPDRAFVRQL